MGIIRSILKFVDSTVEEQEEMDLKPPPTTKEELLETVKKSTDEIVED